MRIEKLIGQIQIGLLLATAARKSLHSKEVRRIQRMGVWPHLEIVFLLRSPLEAL